MADKFTPGPWAVSAGVVAAKNGAVCGIARPGGMMRPASDSADEAMANARLIAAAPELVAALQTAEMDYADLERYMRAAKESAPMMAIIATRRAGLRALLARIEGHAP